MAHPYRTLRAQMAPDAQAQAEAQARAVLSALEAPLDAAPVQACDLCGVLTPRDWLQPEAYQEWDALCPRCFCRAHARSWQVHARHQARPGQRTRALWEQVAQAVLRHAEDHA